MLALAIAFQVVLALGIVNVWILRRDRATAFRPAGASNISDEFRRYGLPDWMRVAVGSTKLALAGLLLVGIVFPPVALPAAAGMALLMVGAIAAHLRVGDPLRKAAPATLMLVMASFVAVTYAL